MNLNIRPIRRDQPMLLPPDLHDWIPQDDMVHFIIAAVDAIPLRETDFNIRSRSGGKKQYHPKLMLALLIYSYATGVFSSRKIEASTYWDLRVRFLTADQHPDHDTICDFRKKNIAAFEAVFFDVLRIAGESELLKVGDIRVDGTQIKANASKKRNITYKRAKELEAKLKKDIAELLVQADRADQAPVDEGEKLPEQIARREKLLAKVQEAQTTIEQQCEERAAEEAERVEKKREHNEELEEQGRPPEGRSPLKRRYKAEPRDEDRCNLTDPDSKMMRKSTAAGFTQSYNAQAAVDADGSMLILSGHVTNHGNDTNEMEPLIAAIDPRLGRPKGVLGDNGFVNVYAIERLEARDASGNVTGVEVFTPVSNEDGNVKRDYDYKAPKERKPKAIKDGCLKRMQEKMQEKEAAKRYSKRGRSVETVFGIIKSVLGFRAFLLRGLEGASTEWSLVRAAYNLKRLYALNSSPSD